MRNLTFIAMLLIFIGVEEAMPQKIIFDPGHFAIVNENGGTRLAAENTHNNYLNTIHNRIDDIKLNISSVVLVQTLIYSSLTQVNQVLRSGIAIKQIGQLSLEIIQESNAMIDIAGSDPYLLLFAEDVARQTKARGINLVNEVSAFVLKEGGNVLMDYEKRDALLSKVILELKVMRALCYSMGKSMYWAKVNGILKTANPYREFINQDMRMADDIINNYQLFK